MELIHITPTGDLTPSDSVRYFAFLANLAAQEATGDAAASVSPVRIMHQLQGSNESQTYLFGVAEELPIAPVSGLGMLSVPASGPGPEVDYAGFVQLCLPMLEEQSHAQIELVLDAEYLPLPGQELDEEARRLAAGMLDVAIQVAGRLGRTVMQAGLVQPPHSEEHSMAEVYKGAGFECKHRERQLAVDVPDIVPIGAETAVWADYDIPERYVDRVAELLGVASTDADNGQLSVEPAAWDRQRLADAREQARSRKSHTLLAAAFSGSDLVALAEVGQNEAADPAVCELTLTVTDRRFRGQGFARVATMAAMRAVRERWPKTTTAYCSVSDPALERIYAGFGAREVSRSSAWELTVPLSGPLAAIIDQ